MFIIFFEFIASDQRYLVFATGKQLDLLSRCKCLYIDGTFKTIKLPFRQLWTVRGMVRKGENIKQVLLATVLMTRRSLYVN